VEEVVWQMIATTIAGVRGVEVLPVSMAADVNADFSNTSLLFAFVQEFLYPQLTIALFPWFHALIAEFVLATASERHLVLRRSKMEQDSLHVIATGIVLNNHVAI